jgi:DNA polymerase-3 subunit alpha
VIAPNEITDYSPIAKAPQVDDVYMTQYDMKMLEDAGLIKMDFLGLKELKILHQTVDLIEKRHGIRIDLDKLTYDDNATYDLFSNGQTIGIFQFSKPKMREYLTKLKPKNINDLAAMNALYRPGPMDLIPDFIDKKHGRKDVTYMHPSMEAILKDTYGIIVFQEQVMQMVRVIAGYSLGKADIVRRAMGKKDEKLMKEQEKEFINGASKNGYDKKVAKEIFRLILKFADYGFNKSHSVAYSILAYHTAYLKTHYPLEFITSLLNCRKDDTDEMVLLINECKRMKISLSLPDINKCFSDFTIDDSGENRILFGLSSIKNVGRTAVENIIKERDTHGPYENFVDFCSRIDTRVVNKKTMESLIYAGAFDSLDKNRHKLFEFYEPVLQKFSTRKSEQAGQSNLFGGSKARTTIKDTVLDPERDFPDWSDREKLSHEKFVLGIYLSSHPLADYENEMNRLATLRFGDVGSSEEGEGVDLSKLSSVRMCGIISDMKIKQSKKGNRFAVFILEDFTGQGECVVFPQVFDKNREILQNDAIVSVVGRPEESGNGMKLLLDEIKPIVRTRTSGNSKSDIEKVTIKIQSDKLDPNKVREIRQVASRNGGNSKLFILLDGTLMELDGVKINYDEYAKKFLSDTFGSENVIVN